MQIKKELYIHVSVCAVLNMAVQNRWELLPFSDISTLSNAENSAYVFQMFLITRILLYNGRRNKSNEVMT